MQEERQRVKEKGEGEVESTSSANSDMPVERILDAEVSVEPGTDTYVDTQVRFLCKYNCGNFHSFLDIYLFSDKMRLDVRPSTYIPSDIDETW